MSECVRHFIAFGRDYDEASDQENHWLGDKPADVVDFECPSCGQKLHIYYRIVPQKKE